MKKSHRLDDYKIYKDTKEKKTLNKLKFIVFLK